MMKTNIKIPANSTRTRILSAFMAFLIFTLTFQQAFVNMGIRVKAEEGGSSSLYITKYTKDSKTMAKNTTGVESGYVYKGTMKPASVMMYDYRSDKEINGVSGDYTPDSTVGVDTEHFTTFNSAISNDTISSAASNNITIELQNSWYDVNDVVCIYLWEEDSNGNTLNSIDWPGMKMTRQNDGSYIFTFSTNDSRCVGFIPTNIIFSNQNNVHRPNNVQNDSFGYYNQPNKDKGYQFSYSAGHKYYINCRSDKAYQGIFVFDGGNNSASSKDICKYITPLYFDCFLRDEPNSRDTSYNPITEDPNYPANKYTGYNIYPYNNFYWQSNLAFRIATWNNSTNKWNLTQTDASVQKLVDNQLGTGGKLMQNDVELPYFNSTWATQKSNNSMIAYENSGKGYYFPFYEVWKQASTVDGYVSGDDSSTTTEQARYYQFNSKDSNVYFDSANGFRETTEAIYGGGGKGFFPFNSKDTSEANNNCCFGAKFQMEFKLTEDGTTEVLDANGNAMKKGGTVPTLFEFTGDDDLWVFIDGNLVLDLGGAHGKSEGYINFKDRTAVAKKALDFGTSGKNNLGATPSTNVPIKSTQAEFVALLGHSEGKTNTVSKYDDTYTHTMTIFYMERGMLESNLKIRYNFPVEANFSKMKIRENTDFSVVNDGLQKITQVAAEDDVFMYNVSNTPPSGSLPAEEEDTTGVGVPYPTYDKNVRYNTNRRNTDAQSITTVLTNTDAVDVTQEDIIFLNTKIGSTTDYWDKDSALIGAYLYTGTGDNRTVLGTLVPGSDHIYSFNVGQKERVHFVRMDPNCGLTFPYTAGEIIKGSNGCWNGTTQDLQFTKGYTYKLTDWDSVDSGTAPSGSSTLNYYPTQKYNFSNNTSSIKAVGNVSYLWVDQFSTRVEDKDDGISKMTNITDASGNLYLMYGMEGDDAESSAEFESQFKKYSTMTIVQANQLHIPTRGTGANADNPASFTSPSSRTVNEYYTTEVSTFTRYAGNEETLTPTENASTHDLSTSFEFKNYKTGNTEPTENAKKPVMMTEVFKNTPKTGAISITKAMASGGTSNQEFTIKVRFEDIFGNTDVDADAAADYSDIVYNRYNDNDHTRDLESTLTAGTVTATGAACGTFTMKAGEVVTIEKIPYNTKYTIYEEQEGYSATYAPNQTGTVLVGRINASTHKSQSLQDGSTTVYEDNTNNITVTNTPEDEHTLKIKEITSFLGVNNGLLSYTKKAAEDDVFKYTVSNQGTANSNVSPSGIVTPTYDTWVRTNSEAAAGTPTTKLSGLVSPRVVLDISKFTGWATDRDVVAWIYREANDGTGYGGVLYYPQIIDNLYVFTGFPANANTVEFFRMKSGQHPTGYGWPGSANISNRPKTVFEEGDTFELHNNNYDEVFIVSHKYSINDFTPGTDTSQFVAVANTNYLWDGGFDAKTDHVDGNPLAGTTDSTGSFYLMYGADSTKGSTNTSESSALFLKQFKKPSNMKVEQSNTLTKPVRTANAAAKLNGTSTRTVSGFYETSVELTGSSDSAPSSNTFAFNNSGSGAVEITETFINTVKTGDLKITKAIEPTEGDTSNTTKATADFEFRITLKNVFGVTDNNVAKSDYQNITVSKTDETSYQLTNDGTNAYATFTLKAGQTLTIEDIPVGTRCEIQEVGQTGATKYYVFNNVSYTTNNGGSWSDPVTASSTVQYDVVADTTREYKYANKRNVGSLTLSKALTDAGYASTTVGNSTPFTFEVTLKEPIGVTFMDNYLTSEIPTGTTPTATDATTGQKTYTITKTITAGDNPKVKIDGIPFGTEYTVTEVQHSTKPTPVYDEYATGTINSESTVETQVTNKYRMVTLTKKDSKATSTALNGAKYVLLRLKSSALSSGSLTEAAINAFNAATENNYTTNLASYYDDYSGILTTAQVDGNNGTIIVKDANMTNGLRAGTYFFVELSPPADYNKNNNSTINYKNGNSTSSQNKIFTIADNDASNAHAINYYNDRKTGTLKLSKTLSGSYPSTEVNRDFVYDVTITGPSGVDLGAFGVTGKYPDNTSINLGTLTDNSYHFTVTVHQNDSPLIEFENLPYGTTYSVYESSTLPACITTVNNSSGSAVTGEIGEDTGKSVNPIATITNTYETGSLTISKALAGNTGNYNYDTNKEFTFTVTLTPETSDFVDLSKYTFTDSNSKITSTSTDHKTIEVKLKHGQSTTISNIPLGTKFTVAETNPNDSSSVKYQITGGSEVSGQYSTPSGNSNTNVITSTAQTVAFTNTYPNTVNLTLGKRTTGTKPSNAPTEYTFNVYFSSTIGFSGYTIKKAVGSNDATDITTAFNANHNPYVLTINANSANDVVISGLPADTTYRVVEDDTSETGTVSTDGGTTAAVEGEMGSAENVSNEPSHTITNHYPATYDLTLKKAKVGELPRSIEANPKFKFNVTLEEPTGVDLTKYNITGATIGSPTNHVYSFSVYVPIDNNGVTIGGIPKGTKYTVSEDTAHYYIGSSNTQHDHPANTRISAPNSIAETTLNASETKTITNTYPEVGSLTLSKSLEGGSNASTTSSENPDDETVFIFKVELTAPSSPYVNLQEYLNTTTISGMAYSGSTQTYNNTSGNYVYTCYIAVTSGDDHKKIISNIPYGTQYKVTEVYNTSDGSMSSTGFKPDVSYSTAEGEINNPSIVAAAEINPTAGVTNTYRKVTLNKKDVNQNSSSQDIPLSGAYYVLLRLKPDLTSAQKEALQAAFASAPSSSGTLTSDFAAYYTNSLADYCNGQSSIKQTVSGQLEIRNSEMTDGLTEGEYFFLELVSPNNYERSNTLSGNTITIDSTHDNANSPKYTYSKTLTDTRKTGTLTLKKTNAGEYKPSDYAGKGYTYRVKLTLPSEINPSDYTMKVGGSSGETLTLTPASTPTKYENLSISTNVYTFDVLDVKEQSGGSVEIYGIPYGTAYEVYEVTTGLPVYITTATDGSAEDKKIKGTVNDSNNSGAAEADITNTYLTGQLTLTKTTSGNAPEEATTVTFTGKFEAITGVDLSKYNITNITRSNYTDSKRKCDFTATVTVPARQNSANIVISGIPYGTQYIDVTEDETASSLPAGVTVNVTGGTGTSVSDKKASGTINSTNAAHTVTVDNSYPASGNLKITKQVVGTRPATVTEPFTINYTLTAPNSGTFSGYTITRKIGDSAEAPFVPESGHEYSSTISDGQSIVIKGLPDGTTYTITEPHDVPSGVSWTTSLDSTPITDKIFNASTGASETITNTFPYTGTLTLSKELSGNGNAGSSTVDPDTPFTFKVTLKEPSGISFLGNYITSDIDSNTTYTEDGTTHQKTYTIYKTVKKSNAGATAVKIEGIPNGTVYNVTEVKSDHSDISGDPNKPSVTYSNTASGTITATDSNVSVTATVTNTYRQITLTKKDSRDNHALNGAKYVLLKLKSGLESEQKNALQALFADDVLPDNDTDFETYYTSQSFSTYCDGKSSIKSTNTISSEDGKLVLKSSEVDGGLTPGDYFLLELKAPDNYQRSNVLNGNIITIANNTTKTNYDDIVRTNVRKTGSLKLQKTVSGTTPSNAPENYTFKVKLTKPSDLTDLSNYTIQKDSVNISPAVTSGTEFSVQVPANGTVVILSNIPYGTTYEVYEDTTGFAYNVKSNHDSTSKLTGTVGETGTNYADPANVEITNTYYTGDLVLKKELEAGTTDTTTKFTYHVELTNSDSSGIDLTKYISNPPSATGAAESIAAITNTTDLTADTVYSAHNIAFDVKIIAGTNVTISGIPYGTTYTVTEPNMPNAEWKKLTTSAQTDTIDNSYNPIVNNETFTATITNGKVAALNLIVALANVAAPPVSGEDPNAAKNNTEFTFQVEMTAPQKMSGKDLKGKITIPDGKLVTNSEAYTLSPTADNGDYSEDDRKYSFEVKVSRNVSVLITDIPYGTQYKVQEKSPLPSTNVTNTDWVEIKEEYGTGTGTSARTHTRSTSTSASTITRPEGSQTINRQSQYFRATNAITGPMQITKKVTVRSLSPIATLPANPSFSFKITLTSLPSGITETDLQYFTINNGAGEFTLLTDENDKKYLTANVAFSGTPADNNTQSVTITGIPQGTTCSVEETNIPANWINSLLTGYNPTIGDTVATATASFKNEYEAPQSKSVTLHKESADTNSAMEGVQFYLLKLNASADPSNPSVAEAFVNSENVSSLNTYATIVGGDSNILTTNASGDITVAESASFTPTAGDKYFFYEIAAPSGFIKDNSLTDAKIVTIEDGTDTYNITYTNSRPPSEVTVEKQDSSGNPLSGAVFDLYYQDTITPPAYTFNEPIVPPTKTTTVTVNGTKPSHPGLEDTTTTTTVTTYSYEYPSEPSLPSAEEADWILPRSDNDYIYFRDYNVGSPADHDKKSFANPGGSGNTSAAQDANRSWLRTDLKDNVETQHLEIDYDHRYWYAAQFSGSGKQDVQYAIWERFVDRYNGQDTVVWKIQPPDGYDYVRFCLYDGGQCIRTTEKIKFKLGQIWHKKDWGGMYKNENGNHCYFNVPLQQESDWAFYDGSPNDKRMDTWSDSTTMQQAIRYTPTEQKVTFHCNSNQVWHNIHIEFFRDVEDGETADITIDGKNYMYVGQHFPGFMMEPYAYAGDNYRVGNYLTYELTIPKEAKYFRVNNGIDNSTNKGTFTATSSSNPAQSPYAYRSAVRQLKGSEENGRKNYDNYYSFGSSAINVSNSSAPALHTWNSTPSSDNRSKTYSDKPVDSDYDYIYFEAPSSWGNHIYAYFYGGGDLRNDNWQRAVYSIWPGVAATATEYTASGSETGTSDIYDYSLPINPESTYTDKNNRKVYKFRVPKGERKNYSKVIFNNGLKSQLSVNGGDGKLHETGVITFHRGYLYTSSGSSKLHNEATSTTSYEQRGDYLYIKNTAGWDDIHIKFYNSSGSQILQTGEGYVMDYSGKQDGTEYFRIAIPKNAAKFSLSTGKQYSDDSNTSIQTRKTTGKYDILRYAPTETDTDKSDYTKGNMVFDLTGTGTTGTLTKTYPNLVQTEHTETYSSTETAPSLDSISNSPRGDYIYIKDTADVMTNTTPTFSFKDAGGSALTSPVVLKLDKDSSNHRWYRVGIPINAASFTINSGSVTYPVYPKSTSSTQQMNVTPGDMYFETATNTTLNLSWPTFTSNADDLSDEIFEDEDGTHPNGQRGDNLYLVHAESALSDWTGMTVTFYDAGGMPMENENGDTKIRAKSLGLLTAPPTGQSLIDGSTTDNADAQGYWYRVAIPYGAATFTVSNADGTNTTPKADIFELRQKITRYSKDYTLGDMQYRLNGTATKLIYPIFTEVENQTLEISEGQTIGSESSLTRVDVSQVSDYADDNTATATTQSDTLSTLPVLHQTNTNTITYSWGGGSSADYNFIKFVDKNGFNSVSGRPLRAYFFNETGSTAVVDYSDSYTDDDNNTVYKFSIENSTYRNVIFTNRLYKDGNEWKWHDSETKKQTVSISLKGYGHGYTYASNSSTISEEGVTKNKVDIIAPAKTGSSTADTKLYVIAFPASNGSNNIKVKFYNSSNTEVSSPSTDGHNNRRTYNGSTWATGNYNNYNMYSFTPPSSYSYAILLNDVSEASNETLHISKSEIDNYLGKKALLPTSVNNTKSNGQKVWNYSWTTLYKSNDFDSLLGYEDYPVVTNTGSAKSATYQPEDRYGYINAVTDANDRTYKNTGESTYRTSDDNYIIIQTASGTTLTDPYIMFYSDDSATTAIGDTSTMETNGISLVKAKITGDSSTTDNTSPYTIRLPKNARSFKIGNGASGTQGNAIPLYENVTVLSADGTLYTVPDENPDPYVTLTGYHHAGTTFTVGNDGNVTAKTLRTGKSVPTQTITDPLYPRTDNDYIFLTDVGNQFASGNTVYAYYYGGEDGEYTAWPGIQASTNDKAQLAYTDNDGNKVYMFRLPKVSDGKYPYVIFNNGSAVDGTRKITQKIDIMEASTSQGVTSYSYIAGGMNYRVDASDNTDTQHYGTYDSTASSTNYVTAYPTTSVVKEADPTEYYSSNKMIYIIENGTNKLDGTTSRDSFDDMHVIFYKSDKTTIVGGGDSGYKPDKLMSNSTTPVSYSDTAGAAGAGNVYRISVPADAMYFQITNGTKDGTTNQYMRQSELKAVTGNGLYRFVPSAANAEDYIEEDTATGNINEKHFLLDLVNKIVDDAEDTPESETYDVKLATVVTGSDGKQKKIIWLKLNDEETEVDTHYLDHTTADIWQQEGDSEVTSVHLRVDASKCYWKETVAPAGYKLKTEKIMVTSANTIVIDEPLPGQVVLKKTAKEKVGTKDIGAALAGAKFRLVPVTDVSNGTLGSVITLVKLKNKFEYEYKPSDTDILASMIASGEYETTGSGSTAALVEYNIMTNDETPVYDMTKALVTGSNGKLKVDNLPWGDYCLEEVQAPSGYSNIDSNTASNKRVYFSVGQNTVIKNITCSDEMEPAYIKLYEHINEKLDAWGDPTFIFKIKQTGYYDYSDETPVITNRNGKEILVALTVDDDGKWTAGLTSHSDPSYNYNDWYQESTDELENSVLEYLGQFRIDEQGRIRLEPGKYEITRMPVSRYEFVENTYTMDNIDNQAQNYIDNRTESEKLTLTIPAERTAIVHYYDEVGYYDKFSQVDEEINKFYTLDENTKANKTIKGIRIADYHQIGTTGDNADTVDVTDNSVTTQTMAVPVGNLKIYKVYVDGTEELMSTADYAALNSTNFNITYTYDSTTGDKREFGGKAADDDPAIPAQFSYSTENKRITVTKASDFENGVYTLKADYKGFKATFDIVFLRSST